ncbi:MAG: hypothetical protein QNL12_05765 [Acidimicrobiia bacterium]|nr:hypothetical protein [Acidimicrobiia bacterium]
MAVVLGITLIAPMPAADAAIDTDSWGGCHIQINVHEHWGAPRTVVTEQSGCARIRASHQYDDEGLQQNDGVWTSNTSVSVRDSGDQCQGRGKMDNNSTGTGVWSHWVVYNSTNC